MSQLSTEDKDGMMSPKDKWPLDIPCNEPQMCLMLL